MSEQKDWADIAGPVHFPEPVDAVSLRETPEIYGLAKWFYEQNATELSDGTVVALGWGECLMVARCIYEADDPWSDHPAIRFAELLTAKLEATLGSASHE